jgi:hypothetical protein
MKTERSNYVSKSIYLTKHNEINKSNYKNRPNTKISVVDSIKISPGKLVQ